jgi:serine/threonine protein kinase
MPVAEVHPSAEELAAFTLGTLDDDAQASIETHVAACTSCQECAAVAPGDSLVELLRRLDARDTFVEPAAQMQTPVLHEAVAETEALAPAAALCLSAGSGSPKVPDAVPPELAGHPRYRVIRLLGAGGMGAVYEAEHLVLQQPRAVKVINRAYTGNAAALDRFRGEVRNAARLRHENIVTTYDAEDAGETHFLVMEYVEGTDLGRLVQERGPLPVDRACDYIRQAALGLQYAFEKGMVHRDLKPHNLMLSVGRDEGRGARGEELPDSSSLAPRPSSLTPHQIKILDFGLAHFASEAAPAACRTGTGVVLGTVDYIAPEQADNAHQADIRSDIYSLGCTLYHLLAGQPPFPMGTPIQKVMAHVEKKPQPLTELRQDIPEGLMHVIDRMMAKKPKRRYQKPIEVANAMERFTTPPAAGRNGKRNSRVRDTDRSGTLVLSKPPKYDPSRRKIVALAAALFFIVAGFLGTAVYRIATDKGELVITTESDDVKVVITQGGKLVDVIDTKTDEQIRLTLSSGVYDLELKGAPKGLKLDIENAKLKRGETVLATITRETLIPVGSKFLTLPIDKVASAVSTKSLFTGGEHERLIFPTWGKQEVFGIPFHVTDPKGESVKNAVVLYGPLDGPAREMPRAVALKCGSPAKAIHLLSGVAGNGYRPGDNRKQTVCMIVRLHYRDARTEDHELINGVHFCDFMADKRAYYEAPGSRLAMRLVDPIPGELTQIRYLAIQPKNPAKIIEEIEFLKPMNDDTAPVVMAVTVEKPGPSTEKVGEIRRFVAEGHNPRRVALSPDGKRLLTAGMEGSARYWDFATGKEIFRLPSNGGQVYDVAISPDGTKLLSCGGDRLIHVWDAATGKEVKKLEGHTGEVQGVAVSPDGRMAASSAFDDTLRLWNIDTGELTASLEIGTYGLGVAFSPDGKLIATWARDHMVRLLDVNSQKEVRRLEGHREWVNAGAFSRDGNRLLTGTWPSDGNGPEQRPSELKLWEVTTGKSLLTIDVTPTNVHGLAISPDGRQALSCGTAGLVELWDLKSGKRIIAFKGHDGPVHDVAFLPGGRTALSVGADSTIRLWQLPDPPPAKEKP